jgi:predicted ATPase
MTEQQHELVALLGELRETDPAAFEAAATILRRLAGRGVRHTPPKEQAEYGRLKKVQESS